VHVELRAAPDDRLLGVFSDRAVALVVAREALRDAPNVVMQSFDDAGQMITEAIVSRRTGAGAHGGDATTPK
jgi:hypothetical protein